MTPEEEESKFNDALRAESNEPLEQFFAQFLPRASDAMKQAAANQNGKSLRNQVARLGNYQAKLSERNDARGNRASENLIAVVQILGELRDDIGAALRGELPGQAGEGDEWKNGPNE